MLARMHRMGGDTILAVCDKEVVGRTLKGDGRSLTVTESFYKGTQIEEETLVEWMKSASSMNIVGNRAVEIAIREGYASQDQAFELDGVRYLVVVMM